MKYEILLCTALVMGAIGVSGLRFGDKDSLGAEAARADTVAGPGSNVASVDLYPKPEPLSARERFLRQDYPELFFEKKAAIVLFSAPWCGFCPAQKAILKTSGGGHYVYTYDVTTERGKALQVALMLEAEGLPTTVVVAKGEPEKPFVGVTPWAEIEPTAEKARKNEDEQKRRVDVGPVHVIWGRGGLWIGVGPGGGA